MSLVFLARQKRGNLENSSGAYTVKRHELFHLRRFPKTPKNPKNPQTPQNPQNSKNPNNPTFIISSTIFCVCSSLGFFLVPQTSNLKPCRVSGFGFRAIHQNSVQSPRIQSDPPHASDVPCTVPKQPSGRDHPYPQSWQLCSTSICCKPLTCSG